jgi:hypothetical protein
LPTGYGIDACESGRSVQTVRITLLLRVFLSGSP